MKIAFLFPGQGAQVVGMGKDVADAFPQAAEIFEKANSILRCDLKTLCFQGPPEKLNTTTISQPAIFTASAAILEVFSPMDSYRRTNPTTGKITPDVTAGLSLGEYTALYAAGILTFEDALILVQKRGQAMQAAAEATQGAMVSIIGLDEDKVRQLCDQARQQDLLEPVNFNCPGQIVVSGSKPACDRAEKLAEKFGAIKAVRLEVAGAFHTQMMAPAANALKQALANCQIQEPKDIKTIANISAEYYQSSEQIKQGLANQLTQPILWQKCMEKLIADGVETFYEIGPGRVLTGLMKRINRKANVINISSLQSLHGLIAQPPN